MSIFKDPLGRNIALANRTEKIVSLVPSQTELLYDLGLDKQVRGITKFCVHPPQWGYPKQIIGGTKNINLERIRMIGPDLILGNKEENERDQIETLARDFQTWISDVKNLKDALGMIRSIGQMTSTSGLANSMAESIEKKFSMFKISDDPLPAAYLIWRGPWMAAGGNTFIHDIMKYCGLSNVFKEISRYPEITVDQLQTSGCKLVLLPSEPFPFSERHRFELEDQLNGVRIILVDGQMFSWYGSRLLHAADYLHSLRVQIQ
ncbi:MAG: helical backbone metal receptor [Chitinophagales bacterium]